MSRILVVSRDEADIRSQAHPTEVGDRVLTSTEHKILKANVASDILAFAKAVVTTRLPNKSNDVQNEIIEQMAAKCEGMFLWIELQGRNLRGGKNRLQLQQIIQDMPSELSSVYSRNWNSILNSPKQDRCRAINLIRWAAFSVRPLTVAEITEAVIVPDGDGELDLLYEQLPDCIDKEYIADEIVGICQSLVEVQQKSSGPHAALMTVHLKHFSVRGFLLTVPTMYAGLIDDRNTFRANNYLTMACLRYIRSMSAIDARNQPHSQRIFSDYAIQYYHEHLSPAGPLYKTAIQMVNEFFDPDNEDWDIWYNAYGELGCAAPHLNQCLSQTLPSRMYYAALFGIEEAIEYLHSRDPTMLNSVGGYYGTPLQAACISRQGLSLVQRLVDLGADMNTRAGHFGSILGYAACAGDQSVCKYLLDNQVDASIMDCDGKTPLYFACHDGDLELVCLLLDGGAKIPDRVGGRWNTLYFTALDGYVDIMELLLARGATPNLRSAEWYTPLDAACIHGQTEIVEVLLRHKADPLLRDRDGTTSFHHAAEYGFLEIVDLLSKGSVGIMQADHAGLTPLHIATQNSHIELVRYLLNKGVDVAAPTNQGRSPLHIASRNEDLEMVDLLVKSGANVILGDRLGLTPLHTAIWLQHLEMVEHLLDGAAHIILSADDGYTPLHSASDLSDVSIMRALLHKQLSAVEALTDISETSLHLAARKDSPEAIRMLIDAGADPYILDGYGYSPADWASHFEPCLLAMDYPQKQNPIDQQETSSARRMIAIIYLTESLIKNDPLSALWNRRWYRLGRCLLLHGDIKNSQFALDQTVARTDANFDYGAWCDRCNLTSSIGTGYRYTCMSCGDVDLCQRCHENFREDDKPWRCHRHEFMRIPMDVTRVPKKGSSSVSEHVAAWLDEMKLKYCATENYSNEINIADRSR